ncbi:fumarylacetoacetate hydrolase family protein [Aquabacterium sp.]|uniref:fumarylacetoacetate hydrolase family protein n=1 Tax=Aquabacterium sp. TaxID=1872578 RepID=UPI00248A279A|nr:fumarylacetoacetate hydrolase family protein [Aquabacterium sp.]MDI1257694.1 fumarylacetoacetate hydrolase family protein [Aquabacterium sp.]
MQVCTFQTGDEPEVGLVHEEWILPVQRALPELLRPHEPMLDLITRWDSVKPALQALLNDPAPAEKLRRETVRLLAPVPRPGKVLGIGLNYLDHINEKIIGEVRTAPEHQVWFSKATTAVNGPFDPIVLPPESVSTMTDYEAELVVIIGRRCKRVTPEQAPAFVFGYCVGNDVSVRDWQKRTSQWTLGKGFDTHAPFGPWITTADEVPDPHALGLRGLVNGEERQSSNTSLMIFKIWDQISVLSQAMTLEPGDVIYTGTCSGVGAGMTPPRFLRLGDHVRIEIDQLGAIESRCIADLV